MAARDGRSGSSSKAKLVEKQEDGELILTTLAVVAAGGVALWGLSKLFGGSPEKMMKAPGKDYYMPRKDFDSDPADWFRKNRS